MASEDNDQSVTSKVKQATGWATGDRGVEAEGKADAKTDEAPEAVEEAEEQVRKEHGDIPRT